MSETKVDNDSYKWPDGGRKNGFDTTRPKEEKEKNDDLEILERSEIMDFLKELRDGGTIKWSDEKVGSLPTIINPGKKLEASFLEPKEKNKLDYEPARIYIGTDENNPFISILFNGSKELQSDGSWLIRCSEARFGVKDRKLCSFGFGTSYKLLESNAIGGTDIISGIFNAIVTPSFKGNLKDRSI